MADHRLAHPEPVDGCMGCKVLGVGWQGRMSAAHDISQIRAGVRPDPVQHHPVTVEEGSRAGHLGGHHTEHWDGRQDATVLAPAIQQRSTVTEI